MIRKIQPSDYKWMMKAYGPLKKSWQKNGYKVNPSKKEFREFLKLCPDSYVTEDKKSFLLAKYQVEDNVLVQRIGSVFSENGMAYRLFKYAIQEANSTKTRYTYAQINDIERSVWEGVAKRLKARFTNFNNSVFLVKEYSHV